MAQHTVLAQQGTDAIVTAATVSKTCLCNTYLDTPPHKCGKCVDYKYLNGPFSDEEEDNCDLSQEIFATAITIPGRDDPTSLKEAKASPEWEEWEHAAKSEMDQLHKMGHGSWSKDPLMQSQYPIDEYL